MKCNRKIDILYDYTEGILPEKEALRVRKHLSVCDRCSIELAGIMEYRKTLSGLQPKNAPDGFMKAINQRLGVEIIKKDGSLKLIIKKLVSPAVVKIPVGAAGLIAASVLLFIFLNREDRPMDNIRLAERTDERNIVKIDKKHIKIPAEKPADMIIASREIVQKNMRPGQPVLRSMQMARKDPIRSESSIGTGAEEIEITLLVGAADEKTADDASMKKAKESDATEYDKKDRARSSSGAKASIQKTERQNEAVRVQDNSLERIKSMSRSSGARIIEEKYSKGSNGYIIMTIPQKNYDSFVRQLNTMGTVKDGKQKLGQQQEKMKLRLNINADQ
ncbi:MAG: zf-HC2 domain-containing protein [Spirochaetes bacterium]|jgi:hypothetical protein|nr:zf-HC2 domain-containing protein [Spirochaetota bacterium]